MASAQAAVAAESKVQLGDSCSVILRDVNMGDQTDSRAFRLRMMVKLA